MKAWYASEDWFAVWLGLLVVGLSLPAAAGVDLLGWLAAPQVWLGVGKAVQPVSRAYAGLPVTASLALTYPPAVSCWTRGASPGVRPAPVPLRVHRHLLAQRRLRGCSVITRTSHRRPTSARDGHLLVARPDGRGRVHPGAAGRVAHRQLLPGVSTRLKDAARSEWYIKTAIVILGASLGSRPRRHRPGHGHHVPGSVPPSSRLT